MIPLIAIVFGGGAAASEVGVGAILGAPFMLSTLAMFVTGVAVLAARKRRANRRRCWSSTRASSATTWRYFAVAYALAIGAAFLPADLLLPAPADRRSLLLGLYVWYVIGPPAGRGRARRRSWRRCASTGSTGGRRRIRRRRGCGS